MVSLSEPLSLYSIPALWLITYYPSFKKSFIMNKRGAWNNVVPRSNIARIAEKKSINPELASRLVLMDGAHQNGLENMYFFSAAVLAGNYAGLSNEQLNTAAGLFVLCRLAYNYAYLNQRSVVSAGIRSTIWLVSLVSPFYILFQAVSLLRQKAA